MPPTTAATTTVSLRELADLAIGTPEVGAVNFTALHTLIVAMLRSLNLQEVRIDFQSPLPSPETSRTLEIPQAALSAPQLAASREKPRGSLTKPPTAAATLESQVKGLGGQVQDLSRKLKTVTSQVQGIVSHVQHLTAPISELDARDWLEEETAKLTPARARAGSLKTAKGERATISQVSQVRAGRGWGAEPTTGSRTGREVRAVGRSSQPPCPHLAGHGAAARRRGGRENPQRSPGKGTGAPSGEDGGDPPLEDRGVAPSHVGPVLTTPLPLLRPPGIRTGSGMGA